MSRIMRPFVPFRLPLLLLVLISLCSCSDNGNTVGDDDDDSASRHGGKRLSRCPANSERSVMSVPNATMSPRRAASAALSSCIIIIVIIIVVAPEDIATVSQL